MADCLWVGNPGWTISRCGCSLRDKRSLTIAPYCDGISFHGTSIMSHLEFWMDREQVRAGRLAGCTWCDAKLPTGFIRRVSMAQRICMAEWKYIASAFRRHTGRSTIEESFGGRLWRWTGHHRVKMARWGLPSKPSLHPRHLPCPRRFEPSAASGTSPFHRTRAMVRQDHTTSVTSVTSVTPARTDCCHRSRSRPGVRPTTFDGVANHFLESSSCLCG